MPALRVQIAQVKAPLLAQPTLYDQVGTGEDSGAALSQRIAAAGLGDDDIAQSTFVDVYDGTGSIKLSWPRVYTFNCVGITDCPWDRNYGRRMCVTTGTSDDSFLADVNFELPRYERCYDRGDPREHNPRTLCYPLGTGQNPNGVTTDRLELSFPESHGKRVFFVYAFALRRWARCGPLLLVAALVRKRRASPTTPFAHALTELDDDLLKLVCICL